MADVEQIKKVLREGKEALDRCVEQRRQLLDTIAALSRIFATLKHYPGDHTLIGSGEKLCRETLDAYKYKKKEKP